VADVGDDGVACWAPRLDSLHRGEEVDKARLMVVLGQRGVAGDDETKARSAMAVGVSPVLVFACSRRKKQGERCVCDGEK
jgi:hypothetical protein